MNRHNYPMLRVVLVAWLCANTGYALLPELQFTSLTTLPVLVVNGATHIHTNLPLRVCGVFEHTEATLANALVKYDILATNSGTELGVFPPDRIPASEGYDVFVHRPHFALRRVSNGNVQTDIKERRLTLLEKERYHLNETELMATVVSNTTTTLSLCRDFIATVNVYQLQEGAMSFEVCSTWRQPIWNTKCIAISAVQLAGESPVHAAVAFPWAHLAQSYAHATFPIGLWVDRRSITATLSSAALHATAVKLTATASVVTSIVAAALFTNQTNNRHNYTERHFATQTTTDVIQHTIPLVCTHAGSLELTTLLATPAHLTRHHCTGVVDFAPDLIPPTLSQSATLALFQNTSAGPFLYNSTVDSVTRTMRLAGATLRVCAIGDDGVESCGAHTPFEMHDATQLDIATPNNAPTITRRVPDHSPENQPFRIVNELPLLSIRSARTSAKGRVTLPGQQGTDADQAILTVYGPDGALHATCRHVGHRDKIETMQARRPVYHVAFGLEQGLFPPRPPRTCAELDVVALWGQQLTLVEQRQVSGELGQWPLASKLTTEMPLLPDTSASPVFQTSTWARPRFVIAKEEVAVQCVAALPPTTWTYTQNGQNFTKTVNRTLSAQLVQTRSQVVISNLTIVEISEKYPNTTEANLVFFTVLIPALAPSTIFNTRCVVPTYIDGVHGFADSRNSTHLDTGDVCGDIQVVFTYAMGEPEPPTDTVRVQLPQYYAHDTEEGIAHKTIHALVPPITPVTAIANRRLLAVDQVVVFSTTFRTVPPSKGNNDRATLVNDQPITMQCQTGTIVVVYTHELIGTGENGVNVTVPRAALPLNGTLACSLQLPRLGLTSSRTTTSVGYRQFEYFAITAGAVFVPTIHATSVFLNVTFHSNGIPPASVVPEPPTSAHLQRRVTKLADVSITIIAVVAGAFGLIVPLVLQFTAV